MSREIKFRAWLRYSKEMIQITNHLSFHHPEPVAHVPYYTPKGTLADAVLMQYIGIKDILDVEIYEGDIVECKLSFEGGTLPHVGEIVYVEHLGSYATKNHAGETLLHNHISSSFVVIGNIHQSPELLK